MAQEKLKTMLMQNFGVTNKEHYGMLWYFWSGQLLSFLFFQEDKRWDWNRLFTEVASELQTEWDEGGETDDLDDTKS